MNNSGKTDILQLVKQDSYRDEIDTLMVQAKQAVSELLKLGQEDANRIVHAMARAGEAERLSLARLAVEETGMDVVDVKESPAKDDEWFTEHIIVQGKHIIIKVNGETTIDFTEPDDFKYATFPNRKISSGTFAIKGHDPGSTVYCKNIMVKPLPE